MAVADDAGVGARGWGMNEIGDAMWDAVVVGAGPAGAVSAYLLARRGRRVLLLEKSAWPREKVCGGCVNAAAVGMLREAGLGEVLRGGVRLNQFLLSVGKRELAVELPEGVAISRAELDARLVIAAQQAGVRFVARAAVKLDWANVGEDFRHLRVMSEWREISLRARLVLACDGIAGTVLESEPWAGWRVARDAWFGVSTMVEGDLIARGTIGMRVGRGGYAGLVRMADGRVHVAAALDPAACRAAGGPARMVGRIVGASLDDSRFQGTGLLTRRRVKLGGHRVLAVGDACGYVEPFTGEGIAWAVRGAVAAAEILAGEARVWEPEIVATWEERHAAVVRTHWCRALRRLARWPMAAGVGVTIGNILPAVARGIGLRISGLARVEGVVT